VTLTVQNCASVRKNISHSGVVEVWPKRFVHASAARDSVGKLKRSASSFLTPQVVNFIFLEFTGRFGRTALTIVPLRRSFKGLASSESCSACMIST
jgi:hypothetical protein